VVHRGQCHPVVSAACRRPCAGMVSYGKAVRQALPHRTCSCSSC
jgi:hypothetical protein